MTDPAAEALARAAELPAWSSTAMPVTRKYLRGWAEAVAALSNEPTRAITIKREEAIASFIRAMLGGDDE